MEILGILVLVLDIWAILSIISSPASVASKLLWSTGIVLFPLIGFIVWYFAGPTTRVAVA